MALAAKFYGDIDVECDTTTGGSTDLTWKVWATTGGTALTSATNALTDTAWHIWADSSGTTSNVLLNGNLVDEGTNGAWQGWSTSSGTADIRLVQPAYQQPTAEEQERVAKQQEAYRVADVERRRLKKIAKVRARKTLEQFLDWQQKQQLQKDKFFEVIAGPRRRRYRVYDTGRSHGNVKLVDDETGREVASYCICPQYKFEVPSEDAMLAQKLMLETNEQEFLRIANETRFAGRRAAA